MARKKLQSETLRHRGAFNFYYLLGEKRSLQAVARKFHVSRQAIGGWSVAFNWRERVLQRDRSNAQAIEEKTDLNIQEKKIEILQMLYSKISCWNEMFFGRNVDEKISSKKISEFTPSDICGFVRLIFSITGDDGSTAEPREHFTGGQLEAIASGKALVTFPGCFDHLSPGDFDEVGRLMEKISKLTEAKRNGLGGQGAGSIQ